MEWGKLKNGYLTKPGRTIILPDGRAMNNYTKEVIEELGFTLEQTMVANGYKQLVDTPEPDAEEGYYFTSAWEDQDIYIVKVWTKHENPAQPEPPVPVEPEDSEVDKILMGVYDNE